MQIHWRGVLRKMRVSHEDPVSYRLVDASGTGDEGLPLNELLGRQVRLACSGELRCIHCGRATRKPYGEGSCYPCFQNLPQNDICIVKPELCHFGDEGNPCRDPEWGERNCFSPHLLYLAVSSGLKVGITRRLNVPDRWIDQGASRALPVLELPDRISVGLLEHELARSYSDRTQWQRMLRNEVPEVDLAAERQRLLDNLPATDSEAVPVEASVFQFNYPVLEWPRKVRSLNLEKAPVAEGRLLGIKGQYLILDSGVLNIRRNSGRCATLHVE